MESIFLVEDVLHNYLQRPVLDIISTCMLVTLFIITCYRLYLHPLSSIPGPSAAAISRWYETYFDVVRVGNFPFQLQRLHEKYGPIIRIGVNEIHILDPHFVAEILPGASRKRDRTEWSSRIFVPGSLSTTLDHDLHLQKRKGLVRLYSRRQVAQLEGVIDGYVAKLLERLKMVGQRREAGGVLNLSRAFEALAREIIYEHISSNPPGDLELPEFNMRLREGLVNMHYTQWMFRSFPGLETMLGLLPVLRIGPLARYWRARKELGEILMAPLGSFEQGIKRDMSNVKHPTILAYIQSLKYNAARELFWMHAYTASLAGIEMMPMVLTLLAFHILNQPTVHEKLGTELLEAKGDGDQLIPLHKLEQLPYLTATIKEGLRLSFGISSRLSRIAPTEDLVYATETKSYIIPHGTVISTSPMLQHLCPAIFPDPYSFVPSRWLDDPSLDQHLLAFSRGTRQCLGMHVAYAVLRKTLGALFSTYCGDETVKHGDQTARLSLWRTEKSDVEPKHDFFIPFARLDSEGVRVKVVAPPGVARSHDEE